MSNKRASPELDAARKRLALLNDAMPEAKFAVKAMTLIDRMCTRAWTAIRRPDDAGLAAVQERDHWIEKAHRHADIALMRSHSVLCTMGIERNKCEAAIADALFEHMQAEESSDDDDSDSSDDSSLPSPVPRAGRDDSSSDSSSDSSAEPPVKVVYRRNANGDLAPVK
jgi:hypothetical protein